MSIVKAIFIWEDYNTYINIKYSDSTLFHHFSCNENFVCQVGKIVPEYITDVCRSHSSILRYIINDIDQSLDCVCWRKY